MPVRYWCSKCRIYAEPQPDGTHNCRRVMEEEEYELHCRDKACGWHGYYPSIGNPEIDPNETYYCPECGEELNDE